MRQALILVFLAACGSSPNGHAADAALTDGRPQPDASMHVVEDVQCQTHTVTTTPIGPNGGTRVVDTGFALVDAIDPTNYYAVERCDEAQILNGVSTPTPALADPSCPIGATCTDSGAALPTGAHLCTWTTVGAFVDGKLLVTCGNKTTITDSSGTTTTIETAFGAIRVHH